MDIKDIIAKNIKSIRKEKWIWQEALARMAGIHRTHISLIERAKSNVTIDVLEKIARALGIKMKDIITE